MLASYLLAIAVGCGMLQFFLDRNGVGRLDALPDGRARTMLIAASIPGLFLSHLGLVLVVLWAVGATLLANALPPEAFLAVLGTGLGVMVIFGTVSAKVEREAAWKSSARIGIPLVLALQTICAVCVVLVALHLLRVW